MAFLFWRYLFARGSARIGKFSEWLPVVVQGNEIVNLSKLQAVLALALILVLETSSGVAQIHKLAKDVQVHPQLKKAFIDGSGPGWKALDFEDFVNVNCKDDTWQAGKDGMIICKGNCNGGLRSKSTYKNFELVMEWKHLKRSGNSGIFIWSPRNVLDELKPGQLPQGIEIQILDHGYAEDWEKSKGKPANWFTTDGDVFPVGIGKMKPFQPAAPNGKRSFPRSKHSKGFGEWNHYYIRGINGEVRLWVNGVEVSGGNGCDPSEGHLVLEAEGAPIEFRRMFVRELK